MWILPKQIISASALDMEALISDCEEFSQLAEQSFMWRSKPSQSRTWRQRWKRESWIKHLSGRILKHSMQNHFVAWWTSSLAGTRANHSQQQENDSAKKTQDTSGRFCADQFELFAPEECSSRMSKDTSRLDSPQSSAIWKKMVTEQRGEYSARLSAARATRESESSSTENWPTAAARDWKDSPGPWMYNATNPDGTDRNRTDQLARAVYHRQWPTPTASEVNDQGTDWEKLARCDKGGRILRRIANMEVNNWPTPTTAEAQKISNKANYGQKCLSNHPAIRGLPDREKLKKDGKNQEQSLTQRQKNWGTPRASKAMSATITENLVNRNVGNLEEQHPSSVGQKLNPDWVEQLMGVPVGWTQLPIHWLTELIGSDCLETELSQQFQQKRGLN